jgi:acyl carrier protein
MSQDVSSPPPTSAIVLVRRLFAERSMVGSISADDDLRASGLTSMDMVNLVLSLEAEFNLQIPEKAITPANFRSVSSIDSLLSTLRD